MTEQDDEDACFDFIERGNDCLHSEESSNPPDYWGAADAYGEASISLAKLGTAREGCGDERVPRLYRDQCAEYLQKGRDALIKALLNEMESGRHGIVTESSGNNGVATITPKMQLSPDEVAIRTATFQRLYALPSVVARPSPPYNIFEHDDESLLSPVSARSQLDPSSPPPPACPPPRFGMLSDVSKSERNMRQRLEALQNDVAPPSSGDHASEDDIALRLERLGVRVPNGGGARSGKDDLLQLPMTDADKLRTLMSAARDEADLDSLDSRLRSMGDVQGRLAKLGVVVPKSDRGEHHGEPTPLSEEEEVDLVVSAAIDEANVADEQSQEVESSKGVAENMNSVEESAVSKGGDNVPEKNSPVASLDGETETDKLGEIEVTDEISLDQRLSNIVKDAVSSADIDSGPIAYDELFVNENDDAAGTKAESMENAHTLLLQSQDLLIEADNCLDCSFEEGSGDTGEELDEVTRLERAKSGRELMIQAKMVLEKAIKALDSK